MNIVRSLNHPNILKMIGLFVKDDAKYIVMEYLPLGSLDKLVMEERKNLESTDLINM